MDFGGKIKMYREGLGMTQDELADLVGYKTRSSIAKIESGHSDVSRNKIVEIAKALRVSPADLMGWGDEPEGPCNGEALSSLRIPVLGRIPAGVPIEAVEEILDYEDLSAKNYDISKDYFALLVIGDSMSPKYEEGDVVIVERTPDCLSGSDCVVLVNDHDATLKRVYKYENGAIELRPLNSRYEKTMYSMNEVLTMPISICGVVKEIRRKV